MLKLHISALALIGILIVQSCFKMDFIEPKPIPVYHQDGDVSKLMFNRADGVNIVIMGDGFTKEDLTENGKYDTRVKKITDFLFSVEPFKQYINHFNIYQVYAESKVSGAADGYTPQRTKFDAYFGPSNDRFLVPGNLDSFYMYAKKALPIDKISLLVLLVNDDRYGGTGGDIATISTHESSRFVMVHEVGHTFSGLADEYVDEPIAENYPLDLLPFLPNVDNTSDLTKIKWAHFLERKCYCPQLGAFEGGYYRAYGIFRPEENSIMKDVNFARFNAPSREAIVKTINAIMGVPFDLNAFLKDDAKNLPSTSGRSMIEIPPLRHDFINMKKRTLQLHKLRQQPAVIK